MDPNATLVRIDELCEQILGDTQSDSAATELAEAVRDLNEWLAKGGMLPRRWA